MILSWRRCAIPFDFLGFVKGVYRTGLGGISADVSVSFQRDCSLSLLDSSLEVGRERDFDNIPAVDFAKEYGEGILAVGLANEYFDGISAAW